LSVTHQLAALELVGFAPCLQPLWVNAEVDIAAGEPARVKAGLGYQLRLRSVYLAEMTTLNGMVAADG
jgi:hypothetical protein